MKKKRNSPYGDLKGAKDRLKERWDNKFKKEKVDLEEAIIDPTNEDNF